LFFDQSKILATEIVSNPPHEQNLMNKSNRFFKGKAREHSKRL